MTIVNHECYVSLEVAKLLKEAGFDWEVKFFYRDGILRSVLPDVLFDGDFEDIEYYYKHIGIPHQSLNYNDGSSKFLEEFSAPTLDVAQRWLREVKELNVNVDTWPAALWRWVVWKINPERKIVASEHSNYKTYEEALETGIKKVLEIILEKGE